MIFLDFLITLLHIERVGRLTRKAARGYNIRILLQKNRARRFRCGAGKKSEGIGVIEGRYIRQKVMLGERGQALLGQKKVLILGCGGLGGYLIEYMLRLGVGRITAADGDTFDANNLNRQLLSSEPLLGSGKAEAAAARAKLVNSAVEFHAVSGFFTEENADELAEGADLILDGLDNVPSRLLMEDAAARHGVPIVHGAILGELVQVMVVPPGSNLLHTLYGPKPIGTSSKASISYTPACCAAIQCAEAEKLLLGQKPALWGKLLQLNLADMKTTVIPMLRDEDGKA